jgi:hypothetical protein
MPIDRSYTHANPGNGHALLEATGQSMPDYTSIGNALGLLPGQTPGVPGPFVLGTVDYRFEWSAGGERARIVDEENQFTGNYIRNSLSSWWQGETADYRFTTTTSVSVFAEVGHERNGVFAPALADGA